MLKYTEEGIEKGIKLPPLSKEDADTILEMFEECQELGHLSRECGVWRYKNTIYKR